MSESDFARRWADLGGKERSRIRRLVRMGRVLESPEQARLGVRYAEVQRGRIWIRTFWVWFVPGLLLSLGVASRIHPVLVGIVLALAAQAVMARRNLGRAGKINAELLEG